MSNMKKLIALGCACLMLSSSAMAVKPDTLSEKETMAVDLNGDGIEETVWWENVEESEYEETVLVHAGDAVYDTEMVSATGVSIVTLEGWEHPQILVSGDRYSDDYCTYCLFMKDGALYDRVFVDVGRGESNYGYTNFGYGMLTDLAEDGTLTLSGSQDMVGTYFMSRKVRLSPNGRFEANDDGIWYVDLEGDPFAEAEAREVLELRQPMPVKLYEDGKETETALATGCRIVITGTDKKGTTYFRTDDGREGSFAFFRNYESWGVRINGLDESEYFGDAIPYAD